MIFKKINAIKKRRLIHSDFRRCKRSKNAILSKESARVFNFESLPIVSSDEYAKVIVDGAVVTIKNSGQVVSENGNVLASFDVDNIFCTPVYLGGREYLYVSDGSVSAFVNPTNESVIPPFVSKVATFHKGRFYFYENGIFKSSSPLSPEVVDESLSIDFLPYDNYGKAFYAVDFCGYVYVVSEGGVFRFTEVSDRRIKVENVVKSAVKISEGSARLIGEYIYFLTDDAVCRVRGNNVDILDKPTEKGYLLKDAITGGNSEDCFIKNDIGDVIVYANGQAPFVTLDGVQVNSCGVFKIDEVLPLFTYEVELKLPNGFFSLKRINCDLKVDGFIEVSVKGKSKKFSLRAGKNSLLIGLYGDEFNIKITSANGEEIIYSLEYEY